MKYNSLDDIDIKILAILDEEKLQKSTVAYVFVTLVRHEVKIAQSFVKMIRENPYVMECSHITGKADYLLSVVARDILRFRGILMERIIPMEEIASVQTCVRTENGKEGDESPYLWGSPRHEEREEVKPACGTDTLYLKGELLTEGVRATA